MKKKLNIESITNELEGASLFFTRSATPPPADTEAVETESPSARLNLLISARTPSEKAQPEIVQKPETIKEEQSDMVIP